MKLSQFRFTLPTELIAKYPEKHRHDSRLMVLNVKDKTIEHRKFHDVLDIFSENDVFVNNNAKVFPARLYGNKEKTGAKIEVFMLRSLNHQLGLWDVLVDPARKIRVGNKLYFGDDDLVAEVVDNTTSRGRTIRFIFHGTEEEFKKLAYRLGDTPIPRYLEREAEQDDKERYQTIFASIDGAVAPPSAGLHFSRELMMRMEIKGMKFTLLNLNIGQGAARPVEVEDLSKHKMDSEGYEITEDTVKVVNEAINNKRRVVAVGGSVMRALESSVSSSNRLNPSSGWTDKFIQPPHNFKIANAFITTFHAPESPGVMAAAAFAGYDFIMEAYRVAIQEKYRFMCYGDAMLML